MKLKTSTAPPKSLETLRECLAELGDHEQGLAELPEVDFAVGLLETARLIVLVLDRNRRVVFVNPFFEELSGFRLAELRGRDWLEACVPEEATLRLAPIFESAISGTPTTGNVNEVRMKDGSLRMVEWYDRTLVSDMGRIVGLLSIGRDVTERVDALSKLQEAKESEAKKAREELEMREQLVEGSFNGSTVGLAYLDRDMNFLRVNDAYAKADGRHPEFFVGKNHFALFPNEENETIFYRARDSGEPYSVLAKPFEYAHNPERGTTHWDWTLTPVKDPRGHVVGLLLALRDVTARIKAIEALKESESRVSRELAEKKFLLHEVHHRVKNNLQIISSLLFLQSGQVDEPKIAAMFDDACNRVRAMSLVHEVLYSADLDFVDFGAYVAKLTTAIAGAHGHSGTRIRIEHDVSVPSLGVDRAIPCGLIISELVTNAIKHAFSGRPEGIIKVGLHQDERGQAELIVEDNGRGMPKDRSKGARTLGLKLVRSLVRQLDGKLEVSSPLGARFRIVFPVPQGGRLAREGRRP